MEIKILDTKKVIEPVIIYTEDAMNDLLNLLSSDHAQKEEFQFIGLVNRQEEDQIYEITEFLLVPNENTSGTYCETDDEKYPEWLNTNFPNAKDRKQIRCQCHSHVRMTTSPSGTDEKQILETVDQVKDYYIQLIVNQNLENTANIYDKERNLIFTKVTQLVRINGAYIDLNTKNIVNIDMLTDTIVHQEGAKIDFESGLKLDLTSLKNIKATIKGGLVEFSNNTFTGTKDETINELFKQNIKQKFCAYASSTYPYPIDEDFDDYPYGGNYYNYYGGYYNNNSKGKKKKNGSK